MVSVLLFIGRGFDWGAAIFHLYLLLEPKVMAVDLQQGAVQANISVACWMSCCEVCFFFLLS